MVVQEEKSANFKRPLVILGPIKEIIYERLLQDDPQGYAPCVPHTTRPKRDDEENGREYFFVTREQMEADMNEGLFMEAGQFKDNLYGTSIVAVKNVIDSGKYCIVDVSGAAVDALNTQQLHPIVIFIKLSSAANARALNPMVGQEDAEKMFQISKVIESKYKSKFTNVIESNSITEVVDRVKEIVTKSPQTKVWVPSSQPLP